MILFSNNTKFELEELLLLISIPFDENNKRLYKKPVILPYMRDLLIAYNRLHKYSREYELTLPVIFLYC